VDAEKQALILAAIEQIADGGKLDKKPNIQDIKTVIGDGAPDIAADERRQTSETSPGKPISMSRAMTQHLPSHKEQSILAMLRSLPTNTM